MDAARITFWKLQSIGNDFPLVHLDDVTKLVSPETVDPSVTPAPVVSPELITGKLTQLAIDMCDRHFGIGGDGLLAVGMEDEFLRLRMFNPDGTEDFCGNGIRCASLHAFNEGWVGEKHTVRHLDLEIPIEIRDGLVITTLAPASYDSKRVPTKAFGELFNTTIWSGMDSGHPMSLFGSALSTGSTHVIIPTAKLPDEESFLSVSPKIEVDPMFPNRTSVIWTQELAPDRLQLLIWERGVGETLGCGTGASAAAADYLRRKGRGGTVFVASKGGALRVEMSSWDAPIRLTGMAETVFKGSFALA